MACELGIKRNQLYKSEIMTMVEVIKEFWGPLLAFSVVLVGGIYFILFIKKHGLKGLGFVGHDVEEIGIILGGPDRPDDRITVYKLVDQKSGGISWCLNIVTKSRKFHGVGRVAGEIPLFLEQEEMSAIIDAFSKEAGSKA